MNQESSMSKRVSRSRPLIGISLAFGLAVAWLVTDSHLILAQNQNQKPTQNQNQKNVQNQKKPPNKVNPAKQAPAKPVAPPPPKSALLTTEDWQRAPLTPLQPGEIDRLVAKELEQNKVEPAKVTTDEQFIRRVTLDLTGQLPLPADVDEFAADTSSNKRAKLIDKLLASEEFAQHWARYWRDVVTARLPEARFKFLSTTFEKWMAEELQKNKSWGDIARAMITASGELRFDEPGKNGAAFFLAAHRGNDAPAEQAAETSRIFMGIQIQCAQCHDHPSDQWKRVQFHELAGYFARLRERPLRQAGIQGVELISAPQGEHEMPSKEDPKKGFTTHPQFLNGHSPGRNLPDEKRRESLANDIVNKNNYWFAGAYVNRIWGELMGQSFYQPVDDMGPKKEAVFAGVLTRLTGSFRASNYDIKGMFRDIMNSETYQRQIRLGESTDQHLHFAAAYPTRLRADALWDSLVSVLGSLGPKMPPNTNTKGRPQGGFEGQFKAEFDFDPSLKPDEVEGSVTQALLMMNDQTINQRIRAQGTNLLGRILTAYPNNNDALRMVYLRTLARKPTDHEMDKCRQYVEKTNNRAEAFEDILWALLNSTEFQTKR
jgi:hypothetical protein